MRLLKIAAALLATAAVVYVFTPRIYTQLEQVGTDMRGLSAALDLYFVMKGRYPDTTEGLGALVSEHIVRRVPGDPWGQPYVYTTPGARNGAPYELSSCGPDAQCSTPDDIPGE